VIPQSRARGEKQTRRTDPETLSGKKSSPKRGGVSSQGSRRGLKKRKKLINAARSLDDREMFKAAKG